MSFIVDHSGMVLIHVYLLDYRKVRPKITFPIFMQLFVLGLLGLVVAHQYIIHVLNKKVLKKVILT